MSATTAPRVHEQRLDILGPQGLASTRTMPLFAYGTLQIPEVLSALLGRVPDSAPSKLTGWRAAPLPERLYPGLVQSDGNVAQGRTITGVTPEEWLLLDRFEDDVYELLRVTLDDGRDAWIYAWPGATMSGDWLLDEFVSAHLDAYVTRCTAWLARDRGRHSA
ncbi:gamma-glutamylcyclotransferase family protein [Nocardia abscessus]|nr:gamma-glutamylcyclotransferase [Nocardia abscessus]